MRSSAVPLCMPRMPGEPAKQREPLPEQYQRRPRWRLTNAQLRQQEYRERIEALLLVQRDGKPGRQRRQEDPARWWEALKADVGRLCRGLTSVYYRRDLHDYHRALSGFLRQHGRRNRGLPVDAEVLRRCEQGVQAFLHKRRQERRRAELGRAKGPLLGPDDWQKARLGRARPRRLDGLRRSESEEPDRTAEGMLAIIDGHFRRLFGGSEVPDERIRTYVGGIRRRLHRLTPLERAEWTAPVTAGEVDLAIGQGREDSAPGPDGLGYGFYRTFRGQLSEVLAELFTTFLMGGTDLSEGFFGGILHLIYKDVGDPTRLENWRPINISNVDYRLLARVLSNRLASRAQALLVAAQSSAVPGRRMTDSLRVVREVFDAVAAGEWGGSLVAMDQSKAFDRVHRPYLWAVLRRKGVPERFVDWLQRLYRHAHVRPAAETLLGAPIPQVQGLRQGCPLSPLLYVLALDPFLERVQADTSGLRGVPLGDGTGAGDERVVLVAHADDATFFVGEGGGEMEALRAHMRQYAAASGAAINHQKSSVYLLPRGGRGPDMATTTLQRAGTPAEAEDRADPDLRRTHVRVLGIWFGPHPRAWRRNWELWKQATLFRLVRWASWRLDVYQRARYVNGYCVPAANFLAAVYPPPTDLVAKVETEVRRFVLRTVHFPLHRVETHRRHAEGGLGLLALQHWYLAIYATENLAAWWRWVGAAAAAGTTSGAAAAEAGAMEHGSSSSSGEGDECASEDEPDSWDDDIEGGGRGAGQAHLPGPSTQSPQTPRHQPPLQSHGRRTRAAWAAYGVRWANSAWAHRWWWPARHPDQPAGPFRLQPGLLAELPDHLQELARAVRGSGASAELCKELPTLPVLSESEGERRRRERAVRDGLYRQALDHMTQAAERSRSRRRELRRTGAGAAAPAGDRGDYRSGDGAAENAREAFGAREHRVPFALWETRWRAYHQVLQVGAAQPWLSLDAQACPHCKHQQQPQGQQHPPRDTTAHFVGQCPAARALWDGLSQRFAWPALAQQSWETVVSGLRPRPGDGTIDASLRPPSSVPHGKLPWHVVRLVNLSVLKALAMQRAKEAEERRRGAGQPPQGQQDGGGSGRAGRPAARGGALRTPAAEARSAQSAGMPRQRQYQQQRGPGGGMSQGRMGGPPLVAPWVEVVLRQLQLSALWERGQTRSKGILGAYAWKARWGWLGPPPIT